MGRVVVIGGGYGGMAVAARLAKLGHQDAVLETARTLGGALGAVTADGFTWDGGPAWTMVPAVVRDLFRKSGRALEDELAGLEAPTELSALPIIREHRFEDRSRLRLPGTGRGAQVAAFAELGAGQGERWAAWLDAGAEIWETLRRPYFEDPWHPDDAPKPVRALLDRREMLHRSLRRAFRDDRLASVAAHPFVLDGHQVRDVPAWAGLHSYLEAVFGVWTVPGGMHRLGAALEARLATRGVRVLRETTAQDLVVRSGRVAAVRTELGDIDADVVVCAVDPRRLPALAPYVERTVPAIPPVVTHLGLSGIEDTDLDLDAETVLHGPAHLTVRPGGVAPDGLSAWTVLARGTLAEDPLDALARAKLDVRARVVTRIDRSPSDLVREWGGPPNGVLWQGRATVRRRLGPGTPVPGVYAVGAHATPGAGLAFVGLSAAQVATEIGPA